jgi:Zn ribbon nucleic-acid-binding protein
MEEFIFDDEMNDVGADIEAHCPKCHSTQHTIVSKYEDEVRRVQCNACGHVHPYKKPREDEEVEPVAPVKKKAQRQKPTWDQIMAKSKKPPRPYNIAEYFKELEIVSHPKFGVGYVTENIGNDKIEVTFQTDKRVLIHNRKGLNLPVAALRPFDPNGGVKAKGKGKAGKAAPPPPPPPAKPAKPAKAAKPVKAAKPAPAAKAKPAPKGRASTVRPAAKASKPSSRRAPRARRPRPRRVPLASPPSPRSPRRRRRRARRSAEPSRAVRPLTARQRARQGALVPVRP